MITTPAFKTLAWLYTLLPAKHFYTDVWQATEIDMPNTQLNLSSVKQNQKRPNYSFCISSVSDWY